MVNNLERDRLRAFAAAARLGFRVVHTSALPEPWLTGPERQHYLAAARHSGVTVAAMFVGFDGQSYADRGSIARTVGLVIPGLREHRGRIALLYSDLARELGVTALAMHLGFLPEDAASADYQSLVESLRRILDYCGRSGLALHLETGQESAEALLRLIHAVDRPNLGVNFDPANFLLYDTDDPLAALERLGPHVRGVHCKDGHRPRQPGELGREVPISQGEVPFPEMLRTLRRIGYAGPLIIEREHGPNVAEDMLAARDYLERLLKE